MFTSQSILYLEDEPLIAMDTGDHLEEIGFGQVSVAYRLENAIAFMEQQDYDLALLDINVDGGQTSLDLGRRLAARGTRVMFASGNIQAEDGLRSEGFYFLSKPFSLDKLTQSLTQMSDLDATGTAASA